MMQNPKVLIVVDCLTALSDIKGGVESVVVNLLDGFSKTDLKIDVISINDSIEIESEVKVGSNIRIVFKPFSCSRFKFLEYLFCGPATLRKSVQSLKPDIVHVQDTGPMLLFLRCLDKRKVVITQHGVFKEELKYQTGVLRQLKFFLKNLLDLNYLGGYYYYTFISKYNKEVFFKDFFKGDANKILTENIYNPVKRELFDIEQNTANNRLLYIGAINKRKGLDVLLEAIRELKYKGVKFELDVLGGTKELDYYNRVTRYVIDNELQKLVRFHGWVKQEIVLQFLKKSSIFILPSRQETLPVSIAEALAAGRVVIATDVGGVKEMYINNESGYVLKKDDKDGLVQLLKQLHSNKELVKRISTAAREIALKRYHPDVVVNQTIDFYKRIIDRKIQ